MSEEIFLPIKDYEKFYEVSNFGRVRSLTRIDSLNRVRAGKILTPKKLGKNRGHLCVALCLNGQCVYKQIHRLVAEAFIPNTEDKPTINHINGNQSDNRISNLEWATYQENQDHAWATELCKATKPKLTEAQAEEARLLRNSGLSYQKIADKYGVDPKCIWQLVKGRSYKEGRHGGASI